ncbi:hypothetical protein DPPLL_27330 [Desulfofustis limnaeus]|uniref:Uncharacterized protein n=1 Tax=Desulfofustis limnaeus TaxID=2740163 RepID=A0ABM7WBN2_9BACT|nr:hypothetical protein DPPLL_27330 [Desulfofustis limnaeus]
MHAVGNRKRSRRSGKERGAGPEPADGPEDRPPARERVLLQRAGAMAVFFSATEPKIHGTRRIYQAADWIWKT